MATTRNPFESASDIMAKSLATAPLTTRHRSVELARQLVNAEGVHPQRGQFHQEFLPWNPDSPPPDWSLRTYKAPDGSGFVVQMDKDCAKEPHDQVIEVNGSKMSLPAARLYCRERFGVEL